MKRLIILLLSSLFVLHIYGQNLIPKDIPTPTAMGFGKFGEIPVSYYTGQPNITIPLLDFVVKGVELPIYLQHDASGVLLNSLPGWTGHNWTLMAGGCITRIRNACPDEWVQKKRKSSDHYTNYFNSYAQIINDMYDTGTFQSNIRLGYFDYQPDVFVFNFLGMSGKFILGNDGEWKVISNNNIDVIFDIKDQSNYISPFINHYASDVDGEEVPKCIKGFTLRDDQGIQYVFGGNNNSIDYSLDFFSQKEDDRLSSFIAKTWYLTRIKDKYGNILYDFKYERGAYLAQFINSYSSTYSVSSNVSNGLFDLNYGGEDFSNNALFPYAGTLNAPVYLRDIYIGCDSSSTNAYVIRFESTYSPTPVSKFYPTLDLSKSPRFGDGNFYYLNGSKREDVTKYRYDFSKDNNPYANYLLDATRTKVLDGIIIGTIGEHYINDRYRTTFTAHSKIEFDYDYATRMHLTKVASYRHDKSDSANIYKLEYYNYQALPSDYLSKAFDHGGYYNFHNENTCNGFNREPNANTAQCGALSRTIYPTGGYTRFQYELNTYGSYRSDDRQSMVEESGTAAGLRVKTIEDYDGVKATPVREWTFDYTTPQTGKSSGQMFAKPRYVWPDYFVGEDPDVNTTTHTYTCSSSIVPLSNSFGPNVAYSYVTVTHADGSRERYHFDNISNSHDEYSSPAYGHRPSPYDNYTEYEYNRGKLLDYGLFAPNGDLKKQEFYTYEANPVVDSLLASGVACRYSATSSNFYAGGVFKYLVPKYDVVKDSTVTYYEGGNLSETTLYGRSNEKTRIVYPYTHYTWTRLVNNVTSRRANDNMVVSYGYPSCVRDAGSAEANLSSRMYVMSPIETRKYYNGQFTGGSKTLLRYDNDSITVPDKLLTINPDNSVDTIVCYIDYANQYNYLKYKPNNGPVTEKWLDMHGNESRISFSPENDNAYTLTKEFDYNVFNSLYEYISYNGRGISIFRDYFDRPYEMDEEYFGHDYSVKTYILQKIYYHYKK